MTTLLLIFVGSLPIGLVSDPVNDKIKEVAGTAEVLRAVPKHSATLQAIDRARRRVTLLIDGETTPREWPLAPDAEIRVAGWWGRLDQLQIGERVWIWLRLDRVKQPIAISMLADELSEQDIHGRPNQVERAGDESITIKRMKGKSATLKLLGAELQRGAARAPASSLQVGEKLFVQSAGDRARLILDPAAFELRRDQQRELLRKRWRDEGLPGTVIFLHEFSGEMELMLDHETMRWARSLKTGDAITLSASPPIEAVVKLVRPWRERTQVQLVVRGYDQTDLALGQRIYLRMTPPSREVDVALLPPDLDRPRSKQERIEWFLASIYCPCKVAGDGCTGDFYTLASCNPNACGMPQAVRKEVSGMIDKGMTDKEIYEALMKEHGADLTRSHLLP